jgi:hypothetical protein
MELACTLPGSGSCASRGLASRTRWALVARLVSLTQARDKADAARKLAAAGVNPIEYRRTAKHLRAGKPTFGQCADELLAAKASEWRNEKHKAQWRMTLTEYAKPLRALSVDEVDTEAVLSVLQPMWQSIPETASRLRARIEAVLDAARAKGQRPCRKPPPRALGASRLTSSCRVSRPLAVRKARATSSNAHLVQTTKAA